MLHFMFMSSMKNEMLVNSDVNMKITHNAFAEADLSNYARNNIPNYQTITEIPKKNMDYLNNVKYAVNCSFMFNGCNDLISIDLSGFDTSHVTSMENMFPIGLESINVSGWNTSNVTNMEGMFGISNITSLDLSSWDTSNVTNMYSIFSLNSSLTTIKGTLDLSSCKNVTYMFADSHKLRNVHLKNVPRSLLNSDGFLKDAEGTLNQTYIIDNILEDK